MAPGILEILTNKEVIAIDQDKDGVQGHRAAKDGDQEIWVRPLAGGAMAVAVFNREADIAKATVKWADLGIAKHGKVRDLWAHQDITAAEEYAVTVPAHGVALFRVEK